jgi:putative ABC transport system permease protein
MAGEREWSYRIYSALLRLYPAHFRREYEREILLTYRNESLREPRRVGRWAYFAMAATAILCNAPKEHFQMLTNDLRYTLRGFRRSPWFATVAVATLALGIGVNSAVFSVVKAVLLEDLPYGKPNQLARVWVRNPQQGFEHDVTNWPRLEDWRARSSSFQSFAGFTGFRLILTGAGEPLQLRGASVTANFFRVMAVEPALGRDFEDSDDQQGRPRKVMLSYGLWQRRFGGDATIVGRSLNLSGETYLVAGVMPPRFQFPVRGLDFWIPLAVDQRTRVNRGNFWLNAIGRLRNGETLRQAQAEMDALAGVLAAQYPADRHLGVALVSLKEDLTGPIRPALLVLTGAVIFVLLICCANVAGMLLAHTAERRQELAIRGALGAGRSRVVRQLLTEAVVLFGAGGVAGIAIAYAGVQVLLKLAPAELPQLQDTHLDLTVASLTLAVSAATGLICGMQPALAASRLDVAGGLRQGGQRVAGRMDSRRLRSVLTVGEMALAMMLLTGSWLLVRSLQRMEGVSLGFNTRSVAIAELQLPRTRYADGKLTVDFYERLMDRLRSKQDVDGAAGITTFFLSRLPDSGTFYIEGRKDQVTTPLTIDSVTPDFFSTMGIPLLRGRFFDSHDRADSPPVILINETTARRYWRNADPLGKRLTFGDPDAQGVSWYTIVGVVADTQRAGADQPVFTESYGPLAQGSNRAMQVLIRGRKETGASKAALVAALRELDPQLPVAKFSSLDAALGDQVASRRFTTFLLTLFAGAALLIAGVGIYGLISYLVAQRRQEFGVRVALGAQTSDVLRIVVGRVAAMALLGLVLGTTAALLLTKGIESLLFGVTRFDPGSYLAAGAGLLLVCVAAAIPPAVQAIRVDPLTALRAE